MRRSRDIEVQNSPKLMDFVWRYIDESSLTLTMFNPLNASVFLI